MYKHTWLTQAKGAARNQEIYEWMTANCSDLFDTITINEGQTRVSCNIGESEILGVSSVTSGYGDNIYFKRGSQFSTNNNSDNTGDIRGVYRLTNAVLFDIIGYYNTSYMYSYKYLPSIACVKYNDDFIFINIHPTGRDVSYKSSRYIEINSSSTNCMFKISSYKYGNGSSSAKPMPNYNAYFGNNTILTPMVCTNTAETPTEVCYWLKQSPTRDTGLITINGKEYFSNGVFCILNE